MRLLLVRAFLLCFLSGPAFSQGAAPVASATDRFVGEPAIVQHLSTVTVMKADGTGYRDQTVTVKLQTDAAVRSLGVLTLGFAAASERVEIHYVRVHRPDGTIIETPIADAQEQPQPVTREAPFYSDLKQKELPIKSLRVGDTLEWQARVVRFAPEAPGQFWGQDWFSSNGVVLLEDIELRVPAGLAAVTVWTNPKDGPPPAQRVEAGQKIYHWTHTNLKPTVGPAAEAAKKAEETRELTPDEQADATDGKLPSLAWTTFRDWAAVGAWYRTLEGTRAVPDSTIKAKVAELTAGKSTDEDKARALYNYVSMQIRYIGVALGVGRYQPHTASEVLSNQYGDCKDKHTLLAAMLSAAGIRSDAVLIGAGIRYNEAVPSPAAFNHLITRANVDKQLVWLDSTAEVAPWRALLPVIRDKRALLVPDSGPAIITQTPVDLPFNSYTTADVVGGLDKDLTSDSQYTLTFRGDDEIGLRTVLRQFSAAQYGEFVQRLMAGMGFGGTTSEPEIQHANDSTEPLRITFHYHRAKAADWGVDRVTMPFSMVTLPSVGSEHAPVAPVSLGTLRTETAKVEWKLPPGWSAELPEAVHAHGPFATCDVTYRLDKGTLFGERRIAVLQAKLPIADWKAYRRFYDDCGADGVPFVQLVRHGAVLGGTGPAPAPVASNAEAARLVEEASAAIEAHQTDKALSLLDRAKALNNQQRGLWGAYGYRAYELGMSSEAVDDYRKEIQLHPDQTWVYAPMSTELFRRGKKDEALAALRTGVAADPSSLRLQLALVQSLLFTNDNKAAAAAGKEALQKLPADQPDNAQLALAVVKADVAVGARDDAATIVRQVLKVATTAGSKNDAAYELSELNLDLPAAEAAQRSALEELSAETLTWTLDEAPATLKAKTSLLVAAWDTMGWILFREGHVHEARSYIAAAWNNQQRTEVGLHLGQIALADNDPATALATFEMAAATIPPHGKFALPAELADRERQIQNGIAQAKKAGAKSANKDARAALKSMRTLQLGSGGGRTGNAEYRILIGPTKVELAKPSDPATSLDATTIFRNATLPAMVPEGTQARVALFGLLDCITNCEFTIDR